MFTFPCPSHVGQAGINRMTKLRHCQPMYTEADDPSARIPSYVTSHLSQLSLLSSAEWKMKTDHGAVAVLLSGKVTASLASQTEGSPPASATIRERDMITQATLTCGVRHHLPF